MAYWVSPSGTATWINAESESPLGDSSCCAVATMNSNIGSGDTVYFREGTYLYSTEIGFHLSLNGVNGDSINWITISAYDSEIVNFVGTYGTRMWGIAIQNSSYIKLIDLIFSDYSDYMIRDSSNHLEIDNCIFQNITSPYRNGTFYMNESASGGASYDKPVNDIWIHDCTFYKLSAGGATCETEGGDALRIGYSSITCFGGTCAEGLNMNITIENCYMAYAGHAVFDNYGQKCIIKNNRSHNEPWYDEYDGECSPTNSADEYTNTNYNGLYSHRLWHITDTFNSDKRFNLYENNRLGQTGINPNNNGSTNLVVGAPGNIIRLNYMFGAMNNAMKTKWGDSTYGWQNSGGSRNRMYQNTLFSSGYGYQPFMNDYPWPLSMQGFRYYKPTDNPGNVFKNNIVYKSYAGAHGTDDIGSNTSTPASVEENNWTTIDGNGSTGYGDPLFVNTNLLNPSNETLPDLRLFGNSPALNGGTYLTQANSSGSSSITLIVDDALYFQDGTWGADMTQNVTLFPDWIAIGTVDNIVEIVSIDYSTNTITLGDSMTWGDSDSIWLYKDSNGDTVLFDTSSNYGAYQGLGVNRLIQAASVSYNDVNTAVGSAQPGDIIYVPAGDTEWGDTLIITKGISLIGNGIGNTIITRNGINNNSSIIVYQPSIPSNNETFRISGFTLDGNNSSCCVIIHNTTNISITQVRIDHNRFTQGNNQGFWVRGPVYGIADNNTFDNNLDSFLISGNDQDAWDNQTASFGAADAFFIEDNTFNTPTSTLFQNSNGAQFTFRYNNIIYGDISDIMDMHGNNHDPVIDGYTQARACLNGEIYENIFTTSRTSSHRLMHLRGGSLLMFNNNLNGNSDNSIISMTDYDVDSPDNLIPTIVLHGGDSYVCTIDHIGDSINEPGIGDSWEFYWNNPPSVIPIVYVNWATSLEYLYSTPYDPVTDTYFYNNLENGDSITISFSGNTASYYIEDTNYFLKNPIGEIIKGSVYTPYTYPHPLANPTIIQAASISYNDVLIAVNMAQPGDIVYVPAGDTTWSSTLTITKGISLMGSGMENTIITGDTVTQDIIDINLTEDVPVRITGMWLKHVTNLNGSAHCIDVNGKSDNSFAYTKIRIDHNRIEKGTRSLYVNGWVYGIADHNEFINGNISIGFTGDDDYSWEREIVPGTADSFYIENNVFILNNDTDREPNHLIYHQEGARSVTRYNLFNGDSYTDGNSIFFDSHGNQSQGGGDTYHYWHIDKYPNNFRGQPLIEVYENTFQCHHTYQIFGRIRGGSSLIYNNTFKVLSGSEPTIIQFTEEESWQTLHFPDLKTVWPAEDQVFNSFLWNNINVTTQNELTAGPGILGDTEFIQEDRDYFMHIPESIGGLSYFTGRFGASNSVPPTSGDSDTMLFKGDTENAYYPYTSYSYPHPLTKVGWKTGDSTVTGYKNKNWSTIKKDDDTTSRYNSLYGKLLIREGDTFYTEVFNLVTSKLRYLTINKNIYEVGYGDPTFNWRGDSNVFNFGDTYPLWEDYTDTSNKTWKYVQIRIRN